MALSSGPDNSSSVGPDGPLGDSVRSERRRGSGDLLVTVVVAVLLAALVRLFVAQVFVIPSESMYPTLQEADRVLVEKVSPHLSGVERGDVVVFDRPAALDHLGVEAYLIKRVIGLPGETISGSEGAVYVDGVPLSEPWLSGVETGYFPAVKVPAGHYFMMGDNRSGSEDSRSFGAVPHEDVVGQALLLMWPLSRVEPL